MNDVALVLGGGGVAGVAWITGVVAGLADEGIDLREAQQILGTSAGSTVGAQLWSGETLEALFARQADPAHQTPELSPPFSALRTLFVAFQDIARIADRDERVRKISRMALDSETVSEAERRAIIAGRLPSHAWPAKRFGTTGDRRRNRRAARVRRGVRRCSGRCGRGELRRAAHLAGDHDPRPTICRRRDAVRRERRSDYGRAFGA